MTETQRVFKPEGVLNALKPEESYRSVPDCWGESHATSSPTTFQSLTYERYHKFLPRIASSTSLHHTPSRLFLRCSTRSAPPIDFILPILRQPSHHVFLSHSNCNDLRYSSIHFSFTPRAFNLHHFHRTRYCLNFHHLLGFRIGTIVFHCLLTTTLALPNHN